MGGRDVGGLSKGTASLRKTAPRDIKEKEGKRKRASHPIRRLEKSTSPNTDAGPAYSGPVEGRIHIFSEGALIKRKLGKKKGPSCVGGQNDGAK